MSIKKQYIRECTEILSTMMPDLDKSEIEKIVSRKVKEKFVDPMVTLDNNVTGENEHTTLTGLCQWIDTKKPVVSGNATFYCQPTVKESPTSNMLRDLKQQRKAIKKEMYKYKIGDDEYARYDLEQLNDKIIMNAEYGGSGTPTAAFYTKYSPAATTMMAQSLITIMAALFESFIGDNQKFFHINECIEWMNVIKQKSIKPDKWISVPTYEETVRRIKSHFMEYYIDNNDIIEDYIKHCTTNELIYIFYANNMMEFIRRHVKIQQLIRSILTLLPLHEASDKEVPAGFDFKNKDEYNRWVSREMFLNPYDIPDIVKSDVNKLGEILVQYCYIDYLTPDSIVKLNNHKRNTVLIVDTDSNIINSNIFIEFILDEIFAHETFNRNRVYNEMITCNLLCSVIDRCVVSLLSYYCKTRNINEVDAKDLRMKNEYMFRRLLMMNKKKRYASSIVLREGSIIIPAKTEIKGIDFIKAGVTDYVTKKFTTILEDNILHSEYIDLHYLMRDLKRFEKEIYDDLKSGGVKFLKSLVFKSESAYKKVYDKSSDSYVSGAWRLPVFRAVTIWNALYPKRKIYSLDRVKIVKLIVSKEKDLDVIKTKYPDEYQLVINNIFRSNNSEILKTNLKVLAIPSNMERIPDWITELIDYDIIISDTISSFRSVLEAFDIEKINVNTPHGKAGVFSSLISI